MTLGRRTDATGRVVPIHEARKGRGAVSHIAHRFESREREADGDALDAAHVEGDDELPPLATEVTFEHAGSVLAYNESPDLGFDRSINPYRGCEHGCPYCYARPTHSYLNLSPGLDFETRLVAKRNAAEVLERELAAPTYRPATVNVGSVTDAYQPIERELRITRAIVEVLTRTRHPFTTVTKSSLVERDLDLIVPVAEQGLVTVFFSLTTLDHELSRKLEPRAASPQRRLRAIATLAKAGVPVRVNLAPLIPFINEPEIEALLEAAADAGARFAHYAVLRLPWEVNPIFQEWLQAHFPDRMQRVMNRVRDMRGGKDYDSRFGVRMRGEGLWADLIRQRFEKGCARVGFLRDGRPLRTDLFVAPRAATPQLDLF
ncbi:MAG TPA: PA0069 family radical SAM protein [Burkholderiaceae bacterium]|jgi:DNA repair photolyase|nr:PA0069 family radical SAM protein [Burkholderiaceae bacterium]